MRVPTDNGRDGRVGEDRTDSRVDRGCGHRDGVPTGLELDHEVSTLDNFEFVVEGNLVTSCVRCLDLDLVVALREGVGPVDEAVHAWHCELVGDLDIVKLDRVKGHRGAFSEIDQDERSRLFRDPAVFRLQFTATAVWLSRRH